MSKLYDNLKRKGGEEDFENLELFAYAAAKRDQPAPPPASPPPKEPEPVSGQTPSFPAAPETQSPAAEIESPLPRHKPMKSSAPLRRMLSPLAEGRPPPRNDDRRVLIIAATMCGLLVMAFLVVGIVRGLSRTRPSEVPRGSQEPAKVAVMESAVRRPAQQKIETAVAWKAKPAELGGKGILVTTQGNEKVVLFESGLFEGGAALSREGESLLSNIGRQLAPRANSISITVIGCTDNTPVSGNKIYKDNKSLGLMRAAEAVRVLQSSSGIPTAAFKTVSYGVEWAPFPNNAAASRARNRTIVLRITGF